MLDLPQSTEFNRRIPKQKFYENLSISPAMKRTFVEQIKVIWWRNKIAPTTINIAPGKSVAEIEVIEISLRGREFDEAVLRLIDREIPYHILFLLECEGKYQAWIAYKEASGAGNSTFKVDTYYHSDWTDASDLPLQVDGLTLDQVYENFLRQVSGGRLQANSGSDLKESIEREKRRQALEKQIAVLQGKIKREKQFNRQVEMNAELKTLVIELRRI